jgi:hypothetical protein
MFFHLCSQNFVSILADDAAISVLIDYKTDSQAQIFQTPE